MKSGKPDLCLVAKLYLGLKKHYRVVGNSMVPTLYQDDMVIYTPRRNINKVLKEGQIVIFDAPIKPERVKGGYFIGRISQITSNGIDIRGDNEGDSIDSRDWGLIQANDVIGIVDRIVES